MQKSAFVLPIGVCLVFSLGAHAVTVDFSQSSAVGTVSGTVHGELSGLTNNATGVATGVVITSYPAPLAVGPGRADAFGANDKVTLNSLAATNGQAAADLFRSASIPVATLDFGVSDRSNELDIDAISLLLLNFGGSAGATSIPVVAVARP
jgi:hypothetical protein